MAEEVRMTFDEKGMPTLSVKGVKGKSCKDLTRNLEQLLGGNVTKDTETREYHERETVNVRRTVHNSR